MPFQSGSTMYNQNYIRIEAQPLASYADGSDDELASSEKDTEAFATRGLTSTKSRRLQFALALAFIFVTNSLSGAVGAYLKWRSMKWDSECALHTTQYSPVIRDVAIKYETHLFNGSFMEEDVYRQASGPEVDAAWEALGVDYRAGIISEEQGRSSGLTSAHAQRADKYGGGFFVNVEGLHHLHCLNLLRKSLYYNYDYYQALGTHAFHNEEHILRLHVSHCLDTLRQVLMCNVDTGVLGQIWYNQESPRAFPDFNTKHTCKNYDDIRAWAELNQAAPPEDLPNDYMKTPEDEDVFSNIP